jgi:hypothetical protein
VETKSLTVTQEGAVSEKSAGNDVDYAAKSRNGAASRRFALADAVLACKLTPEQYNFSHSELEKGDSW